MIALTLHEIVMATGGRLLAPATATEMQAGAVVVDGPVVTDSRQIGPGGLYVARAGETADGHDFVPAATTGGAVAVLVQRELAEVSVPQIVVGDTEVAFGMLARAVIEAAGPQLTVIAVTGSSGKTSTKDVLAQVLSRFGPTVAAQESFNSEIGVPLTVCRISDETRYLVVEMGARGVGHLRYLTTIAPPNISIVLNVGYAHTSEFGSLEGVQAAKSELVAALSAGGLAVLNADDERVAAMAPLAWAEDADIAWVSASGQDVDPPEPETPAEPYEEELPMSERVDIAAAVPQQGRHVWTQDVSLDESGRPRFTLRADDLAPQPGPDGGAAGWTNDIDHLNPASAPVRLRLIGRHHVGNCLAAAAAALRVGMPLPEIAAALSQAEPASRWRMELTDRADGVRVVNDAYNANPDSMAAALRALAAMAPGDGGRRIAVLGAMLELGTESADLHAGVGRLALDLGIDEVLVVGEGARPLAEAAAGRSRWFRDAEQVETYLTAHLRSGDIALFKSSRDSGLRWLGERVAGAGA